MKINIIWKRNSGYIGTIFDYVQSFSRYSKHDIIYTDFPEMDLQADIIVLHYSIIHALVKRNVDIMNISQFKGKIVAIIQDEYYDVNKIKAMLKKCKVKLILSCIPKEHHQKIYNTTPNARIERVLTGYVPERTEFKKPQPIKNRETLIFYRGKNLPFTHGKLGQWKQHIGKKMKKNCEKMKIENINIAWNEQEKIFGSKWIITMHNAKVTLATPSGLNVFHYDDIKIIACRNKQRNVEGYTYKMAEKEFNLQDGPIKMGQISPKMFEAALCGTVLIMYPGTYNDIFKKDIHYIELQPDFSNIEEVMKKIQDDDFLQEMSNRTYKDIVESGKYSYKTFICQFDKWVDML